MVIIGGNDTAGRLMKKKTMRGKSFYTADGFILRFLFLFHFTLDHAGII